MEYSGVANVEVEEISEVELSGLKWSSCRSQMWSCRDGSRVKMKSSGIPQVEVEENSGVE